MGHVKHGPGPFTWEGKEGDVASLWALVQGVPAGVLGKSRRCVDRCRDVARCEPGLSGHDVDEGPGPRVRPVADLLAEPGDHVRKRAMALVG